MSKAPLHGAGCLGEDPEFRGDCEVPVEEDRQGGLSVLAEADGLVHGNRNDNYGHPADDFARTGRMWGAILGLDGPVPPDRVALCMCAVKMSRECNRHKRDNLVDLAGYAETCQMVHERAREVPRGASISRPVGKDRSIE